MKSRVLVPLSVVLLSEAPVLLAQGGGGGHHGQDRSQKAGRQGAGQRGQTSSQQGQQGAQRDQDGQRIRATDQQRDQIRVCTEVADRARTRVRDLELTCKGRSIDVESVRKRWQKMRADVRTLHREHEQFAKGLTGDQRGQLQDQLRTMDQTRERRNIYIRVFDYEIALDAPGSQRLAKAAREMRREMKQWQKQNRKISSNIGVNINT